MRARSAQAGFSLIELMVVLVIFLIVSGAVFGLLNVAQIRYRTEQQTLDALQGARVGIEQMTRDVHTAGYPPVNSYSTVTLTSRYPDDVRIAVPFTGVLGGAVDQTCLVNSTCDIPGPYELIIETDTNPEDGNEQVEWVRYYIAASGDNTTCTLYRAVSSKTAGGDPTSAAGTPLTEQVINRTDGTCDTDLTDTDNTPVFTYTCEGGAATCYPDQVSEVIIQLQLRPSSRDIQTGQLHAITLRALARRLNPSQ